MTVHSGFRYLPPADEGIRRGRAGARIMTRTHVYMGILLALAVTGARAANPPQLREGLWEIQIRGTENPGAKKTEYSFRLCRDHAYDKETDNLVKNNKNCKTKLDSLGGDRFSASSRCSVSGVIIVSQGVSAYQGGDTVHSESTATYTPPLYGKSDETMIQDQRYLGSCPAGMKPGDRMMADGSIVHPTSR